MRSPLRLRQAVESRGYTTRVRSRSIGLRHRGAAAQSRNCHETIVARDQHGAAEAIGPNSSKRRLTCAGPNGRDSGVWMVLRLVLLPVELLLLLRHILRVVGARRRRWHQRLGRDAVWNAEGRELRHERELYGCERDGASHADLEGGRGGRGRRA